MRRAAARDWSGAAAEQAGAGQACARRAQGRSAAGGLVRRRAGGTGGRQWRERACAGGAEAEQAGARVARGAACEPRRRWLKRQQRAGVWKLVACAGVGRPEQKRGCAGLARAAGAGVGAAGGERSTRAARC
jgi:hypothetical protein